jgi:hypothetical protein
MASKTTHVAVSGFFVSTLSPIFGSFFSAAVRASKATSLASLTVMRVGPSATVATAVAFRATTNTAARA